MVAPPNRVFVISLVLGLGFLAVLLLLPFASFILMGLLAVYFLYGPYRKVVERLGWPRIWAGVFLFLLFALIIAPFLYVGWVLVREASALLTSVDPAGTRAAVEQALAALFGSFGVAVPAALQEADPAALLLSIQRFFATRLPDLLTWAARVFIGVVVMGFVVFYGLLEGPRLLAYVQSVLPLTKAHTDDLFDEVRKVVEAVFLGQLVAATSQAVLALIGFLIFGVPHPFFWAFVLGIFAVVPFLGSAVVWLPSVFYLLATEPAWRGVGLLLWSLVLVVNVDNVVKPYVIGARTALHPVLVLVGILGGILFFGPVGFVVGPLVLALFVAVLNFWREDYLPHYRSA